MPILEDFDKKFVRDFTAAVHRRRLYRAAGAIGKRGWHECAVGGSKRIICRIGCP
jgi:hypothetical protein